MSTTEWDDVYAGLAHMVLREDFPELPAKYVALAIDRSSRKTHRSPLLELLDVEDLNGTFTLKTATELVARVTKVPFIDLSNPRVETDVAPIQQGGLELFAGRECIPVAFEGRQYLVAVTVSRGLNTVIKRGYAETDKPELALGYLPEVLARIERVRNEFVLTGDQTDEPQAEAAADPVIDRGNVQRVAVEDTGNVAFVRDTIEKAAGQGASDLHLSLDESGRLIIRMRIDGVVRQMVSQNAGNGRKLIQSAMSHANMDIGTQNEPQSTKFEHVTADGRRLDVRSEMLPARTGPKITWRLLDSVNSIMRIDEMGLAAPTAETLKREMGKASGMVITTGPTGSGKSTTMYALLQERTGSGEEIITIEDPIEYKLAGITQVQVDPKSRRGVKWHNAIKSALRSDPDVILIGEMRDPDTAQTGVQAAMTGHLVLSTLHTTSALGVFARLLDLGVEPFLAGDQVRIAIGQRLVRRIHRDCARTEHLDARTIELLEAAGIKDVTEAPAPGGCDLCARTGYKGRSALMELLVVNSAIQDAVRFGGGSELAIREASNEDNYIPFSVDAKRLITEGITSPSEVLPLLTSVDGGIWRPGGEDVTALVPVEDTKAS
ncbi:Twitching motility protein PilT (plasmid) [Euzebya pacifica]|uniref:Twitching motility protein PilT n=1 Tax=Euzebya pacifica TaxID=1608957 RepID=A0A346Y6Y0_9ACTN|nr:ATPase, T2SS/T4P/T4SS family [Euzebya pacifica]AXV10227.1 Twitching motility protein PilT [Euzebya pacifica]